MKKALYYLLVLILITMASCSDEHSYIPEISHYTSSNDSDVVESDCEGFCTYFLTPISSPLGDDGLPCESTIEFVFISESGEEHRFSYVPKDGPPPAVTLPSCQTYSMTVTSIDGQPKCGTFEWVFATKDFACFHRFSHFVEERGDLIEVTLPDYWVTIPPPSNYGGCKCPTIEEHEPEDVCTRIEFAIDVSYTKTGIDDDCCEFVIEITNRSARNYRLIVDGNVLANIGPGQTFSQTSTQCDGGSNVFDGSYIALPNDLETVCLELIVPDCDDM